MNLQSKPPKNNSQGFIDRENWQVLFEKDQQYKNLKQNIKQSIFKKTNKKTNPIFMTIQNFYTRQSFLAIFVSIIVVMTISITALAATGNLPFPGKLTDQNQSQITKERAYGQAINKQKETDKNSVLEDDGNNNILKLENCELAVKYPKYTDYPTGVFEKTTDDNSQPFKSTNKTIDHKYINTKNSKGLRMGTSISFACYEGNLASTEVNYNNYNTGWNEEDKSAYQDFDSRILNSQYNPINRETFRNIANWLISQNEEVNNIYTSQSGAVTNIIFEYRNKTYSIQGLWKEFAIANGNNAEKNAEGKDSNLYFDDIQIQFQ